MSEIEQAIANVAAEQTEAASQEALTAAMIAHEAAARAENAIVELEQSEEQISWQTKMEQTLNELRASQTAPMTAAEMELMITRCWDQREAQRLNLAASPSPSSEAAGDLDVIVDSVPAEAQAVVEEAALEAAEAAAIATPVKAKARGLSWI